MFLLLPKRYPKKEDPDLISHPRSWRRSERKSHVIQYGAQIGLPSSPISSSRPSRGCSALSSSRGNPQIPPSDLVHYHHSFQRHTLSPGLVFLLGRAHPQVTALHVHPLKSAVYVRVTRQPGINLARVEKLAYNVNKAGKLPSPSCGGWSQRRLPFAFEPMTTTSTVDDDDASDSNTHSSQETYHRQTDQTSNFLNSISHNQKRTHRFSSCLTFLTSVICCWT